MTKTLLLIAAVLGSAFAKAQMSPECGQLLSLFAENAKAKQYDQAYTQLGQLEKNCPDASAAIYQYGERIYEHRLKNDIGDKDQNVEGLIRMLKTEITDFSDKVNATKKEIELVNVMYEYSVGTPDEMFKILKKDLENDPENFTDPRALITYFQLVVERYEAGKMTLQELFEEYDRISEQIEKIQNERSQIVTDLMKKQETEDLKKSELRELDNQERNLKNYAIVQGSVNKTLGDLADCDKLIPLYDAEFEQNASDQKWLSNVLKRLQKKECTDAPLYIKSVKALHALNPSAKTAYGLGNIAESQDERFKYWDQAIELGVDNDLKSIIHYKKGEEFKKRGQFSSAKREYLASNAARPSFGAPFLKIAEMIAKSGNSCGESPFEKRAINWVAARYADKAASVDPTLKDTARKYAASYRGTAPSTQEIFMSQKYNSGDTLTFRCWVGESVRIP
jgi:tetratricopeptide (TPR) repeat protein